MSVRRLLL
uniref:Uncharacterized protein n=1 Tax=Anguilla anguilla TaxID=7936 RepID=A0A0E9VL13_ANGAN